MDDDKFDMFIDDERTMPVPTVGEDAVSVVVEKATADVEKAANKTSLLHEQADNWDDDECYYITRVGDAVGGRYAVVSELGKGVFGTPDDDPGKWVAIKVARSNDVMEKAAEREAKFLRILNEGDADGRKRIVRLVESLRWRNHQCTILGLEHMNARHALKKYGLDAGRTVGLNIDAVRLYARDLLVGEHSRFSQTIFIAALRHMRKLPHTYLFCQYHRSGVKLCDFGSAGTIDEGDITPYLVARYYRPPEVMLGHRPGYPVDVWSVGCTIYELYTGKVLFLGRTNNEMLQLFMALRGKIPTKMLRKGDPMLVSRHFDSDFSFLEEGSDPISGRLVTRRVPYVRQTRDIRAELIKEASAEENEALTMKVINLCGLLDGLLVLDPSHRLTAEQSFHHPFVYSEEKLAAKLKRRAEKELQRSQQREQRKRVKREKQREARAPVTYVRT